VAADSVGAGEGGWRAGGGGGGGGGGRGGVLGRGGSHRVLAYLMVTLPALIHRCGHPLVLRSASPGPRQKGGIPSQTSRRRHGWGRWG